MTQYPPYPPPPPPPPPPRQGGRGLGWTMLIVGIVLCLGILSSTANGSGVDTTDAAETAGFVVARLLVLALAITLIVVGARRLRRPR